MAGQQTGFRISRSTAGIALAGLGMFMLYGNLAGEFARLSHVLSAHGSAALGVLPAVILSVSQALPAYAAGHQQFLQGFVEHVWLTFWPLLPVMAGRALSRDAFRD
jgi:hypothetical protein